MTFESHKMKDIPNLNASDDEWKKYWNSCNIGEIIGTLEMLIETNKEKKPIDIKSLYKRALECKEAINRMVREVIDRNNKLIKDIESGKN